MIRTHTFCGRKYHISVGAMDGITDQEDDDQSWLFILRSLNTKAGMETAVHEALHACNWKATEDDVALTSKDIARFLWRLGYRKEE